MTKISGKVKKYLIIVMRCAITVSRLWSPAVWSVGQWQ